MERVQKFYTEDLRIRASVVVTTELCRKMKEILNTHPLATMGMGRLLTGTLLMASQLAEKQSLSIRVLGNGVLGEMIAESSFEGHVRAYCPNPHADLRTEDGHLNLSGGIGEGVLTVARTLPFQKEPHVGIVPIQTGEIAQDLAYYLLQSQQVPSIMAISVSLDPNGEITSAGGLLIEVLPGASPQLISTLEKKSKEAPLLSEQLKNQIPMEEILKSYAHSSPLVHAEDGPILSYSCRCNEERVERTLLLLGKATLAEMALKGEDLTMKCEFCGRTYKVGIQRVRELISGLQNPN